MNELLTYSSKLDFVQFWSDTLLARWHFESFEVRSSGSQSHLQKSGMLQAMRLSFWVQSFHTAMYRQDVGKLLLHKSM